MIGVKEQLKVIMRGVIETIPLGELEKKIEKSVETGVPLRIKLGVDPTAPDVHLGHTVVMRKLRQFQDLGHQVILIVGDYTATIGDPSGKNKTRPRLSHEEVLEHSKTYQDQFFKIVDKDKTEVVYNGDWFSKMTFDQVTKLMSQITVARMLERDDFNKRYTNGNPISLHEFLYPLMQGYDSFEIKADVEIGGTDQKFNVLRGREIQSSGGQDPQLGLFMPILLGTDGKEKMSKSLGNYVGINENADVMYHKVYSIADTEISNWLELLTDIPKDEIDQISEDIKSSKLNPNDVKSRLALDVVSQYHGQEAAQAAQEHEKKVHLGLSIPTDAIEANIEAGEMGVLDLTIAAGAFKSKGEARRMVQNGGVSFNHEKVADAKATLVLEAGKEYLLQVGKRKFFKIMA